MKLVLPASLFAALISLSACKSGAPKPTTVATSPDVVPSITTEAHDYAVGDMTMKGFLAAPSTPGPHPAVLVVPEWWGQNAYAQMRARKLAELGYVALAVDMYGDGKVVETPQEAGALAGEATADPAVTLARFEAARATLAADSRVDPAKISAVGYCFGGGVVLAAARAGADLDVVASFHGTLATKAPMQAGGFSGKIFIATGGDDVMVPATDVTAVDAELSSAGIAHDIAVYPGATHAFSNPEATATGLKFGLPIAYNEAADMASWTVLTELLTTAYPQ